jgi:hypothetical protein
MDICGGDGYSGWGGGGGYTGSEPSVKPPVPPEKTLEEKVIDLV